MQSAVSVATTTIGGTESYGAVAHAMQPDTEEELLQGLTDEWVQWQLEERRLERNLADLRAGLKELESACEVVRYQLEEQQLAVMTAEVLRVAEFEREPWAREVQASQDDLERARQAKDEWDAGVGGREEHLALASELIDDLSRRLKQMRVSQQKMLPTACSTGAADSSCTESGPATEPQQKGRKTSTRKRDATQATRRASFKASVHTSVSV